MIKKLLGSLAIILLFSGCGGDGDGLPHGIYIPQRQLGKTEVFVFIEDQCFSLNPVSVIVLSCEQFYEQIDLEQLEFDPLDSSTLCQEITIYDIEGKEHTGYYRSFEKGTECD